jgi:CheY-like chemotaxis protein/signal transduction histidine kinase/HAMP domain-containing protein
LRYLVQDNPAQIQRLDRIADLRSRWEEQVVRVALADASQGDLVSARQPLTSGVGPRLLDDIYDGLGRMASTERSLLVQRQNRATLSRWRTRVVMMAASVMGLLVVLAALLMVRRRIVRPLNSVTDAMVAVSEGAHEYRVPHLNSRGEIGDNARALEHFRQTAMREEATGWVRARLGELTFHILHAESVDHLADTLLNALCPAIGAEYAAFYGSIRDNSEYRLAGAYGFPPDRARKGFARGEGLTGQAAQSGETRLLESVPKEYLKLGSGLGDASPAQLLIAPGLYGSEVPVVLELAGFQPFRTRHRSLIDALMPVVAIAYASLRARAKTEALLHETREQAEELRASEAEIRQSNDELVRRGKELAEQSEALQTSEEELRVQAEELQATNEELRQNSDELEAQQREISQAHDELARKASQLEQTSRYKSEFLANMSHELRTPLNSLLILSRSLAENRQGNLDADQTEAAETIHQSGRNLLELINDILDLSKVEAGKLRVEATAITVDGLVRSLRRNFDPLAGEKGLQFVVSVGEGLAPELHTDGARLEQILRNLLSNAFKFTAQGEVRLEIARPGSDLPLRSDTLDPEHSIAFAVQDQGIGIPADKRDRIFQAFEQVDASTSRVYGGTGLGLSISRHLATLLGGEIHLWSEEGRGSRFVLVVPRQMPGAQPAPNAPPTVAPEPLPQRRTPAPRPEAPDILIIEDDTAFARILEQEARRRGYDTRIANDGEAGLASATARPPTGILLDIGLPGMDGWAVLERLKQQPQTQDVPVHIISAADDDGRAAAMGAAGYLSKPVDVDALSGLLDSVGPGSAIKRVLVVDDDKAARQAIDELLGRQTLKIVYAEDGAKALATLAKQDFDCVLLDLNLPDMSGFDLLDRLSEKTGHAPVIVFSARELTDEETRRLRAHTDSIIIKGGRSSDRLLDEVNLFLHRIDDKTGAALPPMPSGGVELAGRRVLIVDDDMRNTFALSRILRERDMQVLMAQDGRKALDQLEANPDIDVVLMDIMMPVMDGYETMREIRKRPGLSGLPIIALTAKAMEGDRQKCLEAGANDYLPKPIDMDKLLSMMRAWI